MTATRNGPRPGRRGGSGTTFLGPVAAFVVLFAFGCETGTDECVANYEFEVTRR